MAGSGRFRRVEIAMRAIRVALILAAGCGWLRGADETATDTPQAVLKSHVSEALAEVHKQLLAENPQPVTRSLPAAALAEVMLNNDPAAARALLERVFAAQDMDPKSARYGDVPWQLGHPETKDPNAIQFTALPMAALFLQYGDNFPEDFQARAKERLRAALQAVEAKTVPIWYTNIYLMKLANQILLGDYVGDEESVARGKKALAQWLDFTKTNGITEYNSAVYAGVQLDVLHTLHNLTRDEEAKTLARAALDDVWADAAANYFPAAEMLSGASSRTYNFLGTDLNLNQYYYLFGIQPTAPGRVGDICGELLVWANSVWGGYAPPPALVELAHQPNRLVQQRAGAESGKDRYNFITPSFSLGSASFFYEHQDREVCLTLGSAKKLPLVSVMLDPFDAPYGKVRIREGNGGHLKVMHLRNEISAVQDKGAVLALMNLATEAAKRIGGSVATDIILPLNADGLYLNEKPISWGKGVVPVSANSVIGIREGRTGAAVRIFHADSAMPEHPVFFLRKDGERYHAARLVAYHSRGRDGVAPVPMLRSGVIFLARECPTEEDFQKFLADAQAWQTEEQMRDGVWRVKAWGTSPTDQGAPLELVAALDIANRQPGERLVNGQKYDDTKIFSVNGEALSATVPAPQKEEGTPEAAKP